MPELCTQPGQPTEGGFAKHVHLCNPLTRSARGWPRQARSKYPEGTLRRNLYSAYTEQTASARVVLEHELIMNGSVSLPCPANELRDRCAFAVRDIGEFSQTVFPPQLRSPERRLHGACLACRVPDPVAGCGERRGTAETI